MSILGFLSGALKPLGDIIDDVVGGDKKIAARTAMLQVERALETKLVEYDTALAGARRDIIVAEAKSDSWLTRSWRPITMLTFVIIIANNYLIVPYAQAFGAKVVSLDIPNGMWALLTTGIGGYVVGRSAVKIMKAKNGK